jgi:hypothetical protein
VARPATQCAAVRTTSGVMRVPLHQSYEPSVSGLLDVSERKPTGMSYASAFGLPLMIASCVSPVSSPLV